eukprot:CAMPEP_0184360746 /NCGR_PEP_ID=MMETSP1089-20130417/126502_1 /TAXON_ID=38269 ORGANISM="Gloeochaete wittrockiana, Strain SAG46.84" /NCGR_SAMPLE_ID=MMETSP1089 /ASSEMBLY_ACC=CAM_ASM_000445 /LENGTH=207 /DNA_ID=CAMNT_0026700065 /DNA_START=178 /DNA_END=797 /DNA_ORIENTATION=-
MVCAKSQTFWLTIAGLFSIVLAAAPGAPGTPYFDASIGTNAAVVRWIPPTNTDSSTKYVGVVYGLDAVTQLSNFTTSQQNFQLTGLTANTQYYVNVFAINTGNVIGPYSPMGTFTTIPNQMAAPTFMSIYSTSSVVIWNRPSGNGIIIRYEVQIGISTIITVSGSLTNVTIGNLTYGTTYECRLTAFNAGGKSAQSSAGLLITGSPP